MMGTLRAREQFLILLPRGKWDTIKDIGSPGTEDNSQAPREGLRDLPQLSLQGMSSSLGGVTRASTKK